MTDAEKIDAQKIVDDYASKLAEHFDSVRVFVTRHSDDCTKETFSYETGRGNFYAQLGQIHEFISIQDQFQREWAAKKSKHNDE